MTEGLKYVEKMAKTKIQNTDLKDTPFPDPLV